MDKNKKDMLSNLFVARLSLNIAQANAPNGSNLQKAIYDAFEDVNRILEDISDKNYSEKGEYQ